MIDTPSGSESVPTATGRVLSVDAVVVPLDGSDHGIPAIGVAAAIANNLGCLVTTISFAPVDGARRFETRIRRLVRSTLASTPYSVMIRESGPAVATDIRNELARQPGALLCMPTSGRGGSAVLAGSVATTIVSDLSSPVLLVGPACDVPAFDLARPLCIAVDPQSPAEETVLVARAWQSTFGSGAERSCSVPEGLTASVAAERVVDQAAQSSAIVMAARTDEARSVVAEVTRLAHCPVLVHG